MGLTPCLCSCWVYEPTSQPCSRGLVLFILTMPYRPARTCPLCYKPKPCSCRAKPRNIGSQMAGTRAWQVAARAHLDLHPLCSRCQEQGRITEATVVHHVQAHRGDPVLFWSSSNWASLCKACHDELTAQGL